MAKKNLKSITVGFVSLGCPKNTVDSERMLAEIIQAGCLISSDPDDADVVVINTCGFIAPARQEAVETIKHAVDCKRKGSVKKIIVAGCMAERSGKGLFDEVEGIDAVVGLGQRDMIADIVKQTLSSGRQSVYLEPSSAAINDDRARLLITPRHWAYLRISEGCSHNCSFCTIPSIRGKLRSKPAELVLSEARELISSGVVELNIIAQDITSYGRDLGKKDSLPELLEKLSAIGGVRWIRLMYLYAAGLTDRLINTIRENEKILHYLDVPLQHVNSRILKDMKRPETKEKISRLIDKLRHLIPDIVLRTTLIVGFPGETEEEFQELLGFVERARFDALGAFKYCAEAGTPAASMPGQIPQEVKQQRMDRLMLTQQAVVFEKNKGRIGTKLTCLIDAADAGAGRGRFYGQAPDIDSICIIRGCTAAKGTFADVKITGTKDYDLTARQIR